MPLWTSFLETNLLINDTSEPQGGRVLIPLLLSVKVAIKHCEIQAEVHFIQ